MIIRGHWEREEANVGASLDDARVSVLAGVFAGVGKRRPYIESQTDSCQ